MKIIKIVLACVMILILTGMSSVAFALELRLPEELIAIEDKAFYKDSSLDIVILPNGIKTIGNRAFGFSSVKEINLPKSLTSIAANAFVGCDQLVVDAPVGSLGWNYAKEYGFALKNPTQANTVRLFNGKIEIAEPLNHAAKAYEEATGKHVEVESVGYGVDLQATLKQYYQTGIMPDIFVCEDNRDFCNWTGMMVDMSDQPWAADTDAGFVDESGALVGFPYTTEAIGLAYNKSILEKAGVDPASITGPESMKAAFEAIDAKKDELGITAVIGYCANATELYWSTGQHLFGQYLDAGLAREDTTYYDMLMEGKLDHDRFLAFSEMVDLFNKYADPALLVSGNYDMQVSGFAAGKYAFVTQGSWIGSSLTNQYKEQYAAAGNFECGFIPYCFEEGVDTILTNVPSWWVVYKGGRVSEAEAFLNWLASTEGQKIMVEEAGLISPFMSCTTASADPFAGSIASYNAKRKTSAWHWLDLPANLAHDYTGAIFQDFAMGVISTEEFVEDMSDTIGYILNRHQ